VRAVKPLIAATEPRAATVEKQRMAIGSDGRQRRRQRTRRAGAAAAGDAQLVGALAGRIADHVNHADEGSRAKHDRRRAFHDLDALDVVEIQGRNRRVERATPGHTVDHEQEGVELVQSPQ